MKMAFEQLFSGLGAVDLRLTAVLKPFERHLRASKQDM